MKDYKLEYIAWTESKYHNVECPVTYQDWLETQLELERKNLEKLENGILSLRVTHVNMGSTISRQILTLRDAVFDLRKKR